MKRRQPTKLRPRLRLMTGIVTTLCAYLMLYLIREALCGMTAVAVETATTCTLAFSRLVMNLPLVFFIAGGISTMVFLAWRRDH